MSEEERGTLKEGAIHPAAHSAMHYVKEYMLKDIRRLMMIQESFASCAISGNVLSEICGETLRRVMNSEAVSDRYLLGLAWTLKTMEDESKDNEPPKPKKRKKAAKRIGKIQRGKKKNGR